MSPSPGPTQTDASRESLNAPDLDERLVDAATPRCAKIAAVPVNDSPGAGSTPPNKKPRLESGAPSPLADPPASASDALDLRSPTRVDRIRNLPVLMEEDLDADDDEAETPQEKEITTIVRKGLEVFVKTQLDAFPAVDDLTKSRGPAWRPPSPPLAGEDDDEVVYPAQETCAKQLFEKVEKALLLTGASAQSLKDKFDKFELRIQVANLNTLHDQTVDRLKKYIRHHRTKVPGFFGRHVQLIEDAEEECLTGGLVQKNNFSDEQLRKREKLMEDVTNNPETLFLVVHDEAHYEATNGGAADGLINHDVLRYAQNVVTLFVSATPYNLVTQDSQVPEANVVNWETNDAAAEGTERYFGLKHYEEHRKDADADQGTIKQGSLCASDAQFNKRVKNLLNGKKDAVSKQSALLRTVISEYVEALKLTDDEHVPGVVGTCRMFPRNHDCRHSLTERMVRDLVNVPVDTRTGSTLGPGIMIMLRQNKLTGQQIFDAVIGARNKLQLHDRFAVLIDIQSKGQGGIRRCLQQHNPEIYEAMKSANGGKDPTMEQYSDLKNVPCMLILCERGKMGKVFALFPRSFVHFVGPHTWMCCQSRCLHLARALQAASTELIMWRECPF